MNSVVQDMYSSVLVCVFLSLCAHLAPSVGGSPPLRASASTTVSVNLLDLNDNDPTFLNLPFVAEVPEGLPVGTSFFRVKIREILICRADYKLLGV